MQAVAARRSALRQCDAREEATNAATDRCVEATSQAGLGRDRSRLRLRVTDNGAKTFVLVGRFGSKNPTARAIGKVGAISLEEARTKAREWLKLVAVGQDPAHVAAAAARDTLAAICEEYLKRRGPELRSVDLIRSMLGRSVLPTLGSRPIADIRRSDIVRLLDGIEDASGPVAANRTLALLGTVMNWYAGRTDDYASPIIRGMARRKEVARDRILTDEELRAIWQATAQPTTTLGAEWPAHCAYIRFLLLTGARRNEAAKTRWAEITGDSWTLPAARNKTGVELVRPLSQAALAIISGLPRHGDFVFSRTGEAALSGLSRFKIELDRASGTEGWVIHDLRRTARSLMSRAGVTSDHAERCLGHVIGSIRGVYDRHLYRDEMLLAYEKLASLVSEIVDPQPNVVSINRNQQVVR
jgi:integrase